MSQFKAKMHRIRFLVSVPLSDCSIVRLSLRWSLTLKTRLPHLHVTSALWFNQL